MKYVLEVPDDLDGYEGQPGEFDTALRMHLESWLADQWCLEPAEDRP